MGTQLGYRSWINLRWTLYFSERYDAGQPEARINSRARYERSVWKTVMYRPVLEKILVKVLKFQI